MSGHTVERNLILVGTDGAQWPQDFEEIKARVEQLAPEIEVTIVDNRARTSVTARRLAERPSLILSLYMLDQFRPRRGKVYSGRMILKDEQQKLLEAAGLPVPPAVLLTPDIVLDPAVWGDVVIVKPTAEKLGSFGRGLELRRTEAVRYQPPESYSSTDPRHLGPQLVQRFIDTGPHPVSYRALTFFGEPLYLMRFTLNTARPDLTADDATLSATPVAANSENRSFGLAVDPDILELARRVNAVAPDVPLKGVDIIRDVRDGSLWVLEFNPGGNTWGFSSDIGIKLRQTIGAGEGRSPDEAELVGRRMLIDQLGGFDTVARLLVERTRSEAE